MTTVYELTPTEPPVRPHEPPVTVRAERDVVIVEPCPGQLDSAATTALAATINAAVDTGALVLIDLGSPPLDQSLLAAPRARRRTPSPVARMAGPGFVEFAAGDEPWLLDVVSRRLSRVHADDRRFLPPDAWLPVRAVTVSAEAVSVTTDTGNRIVAYRSR